MRKVMKRVIVGLIALSMMMGTTEASAVSTSKVKKIYQGFYEHET